MEIEFLCKVDFYRTIQLLKLTTRNTHALNFRKSRLPFGVISPFTKLSNLQFHVCCCCWNQIVSPKLKIYSNIQTAAAAALLCWYGRSLDLRSRVPRHARLLILSNAPEKQHIPNAAAAAAYIAPNIAKQQPNKYPKLRVGEKKTSPRPKSPDRRKKNRSHPLRFVSKNSEI